MCFRDVYKEPRHIKKSGEPGDDEDDVNCLQIKERHAAKVMMNGVKTKGFLTNRDFITHCYLPMIKGDEILPEQYLVLFFSIG